MMAAPFDYSWRTADTRVAHLTQQAAAREQALRDEVALWKSHRAWSDQLLKAYTDLLAERGL